VVAAEDVGLLGRGRSLRNRRCQRPAWASRSYCREYWIGIIDDRKGDVYIKYEQAANCTFRILSLRPRNVGHRPTLLVLAGLSGCLMGDCALMPDQMQYLSRITPHAWALDAYRQLLTMEKPGMEMVGTACGVLTGFVVGFLALAWWCLKLDADGLVST
jgi:hypothetical protein